MPQSKEQIAAYRKEYNKKNKEQRAAYAKKYYENNKEQIASKAKEYYEKNKEQIAARNKEYYEKNRERWLAYRKEYYENNKEQIAAYNKEQVFARQKEYNKKYYANNKEKNNISCKEWYQNNKETLKVFRRFNKYGISSAEYDNMLEEQDNKCKICLTSFADITLKNGRTSAHIDHCHTTNKIRGLLCNYCNSGLGFFKDNTETLANAIVYLEHTME